MTITQAIVAPDERRYMYVTQLDLKIIGPGPDYHLASLRADDAIDPHLLSHGHHHKQRPPGPSKHRIIDGVQVGNRSSVHALLAPRPGHPGACY